MLEQIRIHFEGLEASHGRAAALAVLPPEVYIIGIRRDRDNAVDEALVDTIIEVTINEDNSITVIDDGCGILPAYRKSGFQFSAVEVVRLPSSLAEKFKARLQGVRWPLARRGAGASAKSRFSEWRFRSILSKIPAAL